MAVLLLSNYFSRMQGISEDLIVDEEQLREKKERIEAKSRELEGFLSDYLAILRRAKLFGLMSGKSAEALNDYIRYASKLQGTLATAGRVYSKSIESYVHEIDVADNYLF